MNSVNCVTSLLHELLELSATVIDHPDSLLNANNVVFVYNSCSIGGCNKLWSVARSVRIPRLHSSHVSLRQVIINLILTSWHSPAIMLLNLDSVELNLEVLVIDSLYLKVYLFTLDKLICLDTLWATSTIVDHFLCSITSILLLVRQINVCKLSDSFQNDIHNLNIKAWCKKQRKRLAIFWNL